MNERQLNYEKFMNVLYYIIIGLVSLLATVFIPMLSSEIGVEWVLPNTSVGWCIFVITKLTVAMVNILLFHCFMEQAKVNIKDNEKFIRANDILSSRREYKILSPRSPKKWNVSQYLTKGTSIFFMSVLSAVGLSQAIITFDLVSFLTYLFTIIMGIVFGVLQMKKAEYYWTNEYYEFALKIEKEDIKIEEKGENENA
jgi:uncharacterized membrane protein